MSKRKIIILGAGVTGLSAGWHFKKKGSDPIVFEKESGVGGLCRSKRINGFTFDYCGHLLHFRNSYSFNLVTDLLKNNLREHQRSSWVYYSGRLIPYPFQCNLYGLPKRIIQECFLGFMRTLDKHKAVNKKNLNLHDWINYIFGRGVAKHFMIPYNTKFWTVSPKELTAEWTDGFIPVPNLNDILEGMTARIESGYGYNTRFWYPKRGIREFPLGLAKGLKNIRLNSEVIGIDLKKRLVKIKGAGEEEFDCLISTIPLPDLPNLLYGLPGSVKKIFQKLRWNSILNLNLGLAGKDGLKRHWIYFSEKKPCFFRLGFFNNFSDFLAPPGASSLYVEVAYSPERPIDKCCLVKKSKEDLKEIGILSKNVKILASDVNDIKYGYPIYDFNRQDSVTKIMDYLNKNRIFSIGRYGGWKYSSMEDAILEGRDIAEKLYG